MEYFSLPFDKALPQVSFAISVQCFRVSKFKLGNTCVIFPFVFCELINTGNNKTDYDDFDDTSNQSLVSGNALSHFNTLQPHWTAVSAQTQ